MTWRAAHGKAAELGHLVVSETPPTDELPSATPADAVGVDRAEHGHFAPGNRLGAAKRLRVGPTGSLRTLAEQGDAAYQACMRWGRRYGAHRRRELAAAHGGAITAGVGSIVESAGELMASSRYWMARSVAEGDADFARLSAQLAAQARGCERDAWELASREAQARPPREADVPWLLPRAHDDTRPSRGKDSL